MQLPETPKSRIGRPLSFNREVALGQAMHLFWQHGYEATSLKDLTSALGIPPSSIYATFGDKKTLFLAAIACYLSGPVTSQSIIAGASTAREAAAQLLRTAAIGFTGAHTPAGCLLASSAISCSNAASDVKEELACRRRAIEAHLKHKITRAVRSGELPKESSPGALAALTMAVIQGMSTLARDGASRNKLLSVGESAMLAWPASPRRKIAGR